MMCLLVIYIYITYILTSAAFCNVRVCVIGLDMQVRGLFVASVTMQQMRWRYPPRRAARIAA